MGIGTVVRVEELRGYMDDYTVVEKSRVVFPDSPEVVLRAFFGRRAVSAFGGAVVATGEKYGRNYLGNGWVGRSKTDLLIEETRLADHDRGSDLEVYLGRSPEPDSDRIKATLRTYLERRLGSDFRTEKEKGELAKGVTDGNEFIPGADNYFQWRSQSGATIPKYEKIVDHFLWLGRILFENENFSVDDLAEISGLDYKSEIALPDDLTRLRNSLSGYGYTPPELFEPGFWYDLLKTEKGPTRPGYRDRLARRDVPASTPSHTYIPGRIRLVQEDDSPTSWEVELYGLQKYTQELEGVVSFLSNLSVTRVSETLRVVEAEQTREVAEELRREADGLERSAVELETRTVPQFLDDQIRRREREKSRRR